MESYLTQVADAVGSIVDPDHKQTLKELDLIKNVIIQGSRAEILWNTVKPNCHCVVDIGLCMKYRIY